MTFFDQHNMKRLDEHYTHLRDFPGGTSSKEPTCQCRRHKKCGSDPWMWKILWRRAWQPTSVFLPEESMDRGAWWLQSIESQRVGHDQNYLAHTHTFTLKHFGMHFLLLPILLPQWPLPLQGYIPNEPFSFSLGPDEADLSRNHTLKDSHSNQSREAHLLRVRNRCYWKPLTFWDCYSL